jgi:flavodoxin
MKVLITYRSQSGNTKKIAEAIYDVIDAEKDIQPIQEVESLEGYDLSFIGFPIEGFGPNKSIIEFLEKHTQGKKIALFITHAAPEGAPPLNEWFAPARKGVAGGELLGLFDCRGALAQPVKEHMLKSGNPDLARWAEMDDSQGYPDEASLGRARAFGKEITAKVL